jgi:hypothetical protein
MLVSPCATCLPKPKLLQSRPKGQDWNRLMRRNIDGVDHFLDTRGRRLTISNIDAGNIHLKHASSLHGDLRGRSKRNRHPHSDPAPWFAIERAFIEINRNLVALVRRQLVVESHVYLDQSRGRMKGSAGIAPRVLKEVAVHSRWTFHACLWGYVRNGQSCRGVQSPQRVNSFSISIRRNRSTRNMLALRKIWS